MVDNIDSKTVESFGDEWTRFNQSSLGHKESKRLFDDYFRIFPWDALPEDPTGFDMGCGSGRWAKLVAPRVSLLHCLDPSSQALETAKTNLAGCSNVILHQATANNNDLAPSSQDFGYSLGVLHHIPDTLSALICCVQLLKPGAPFLLYLYYAFDNRPWWYRTIWLPTNLARKVISRLPTAYKNIITDLIAYSVYLPCALLASFLESQCNLNVSNIPLSSYRNSSLMSIKTDSRDRFGTPLEQRFTRSQIAEMCYQSGLRNLQFSCRPPYHCVVGYKAK